MSLPRAIAHAARTTATVEPPTEVGLDAKTKPELPERNVPPTGFEPVFPP
jgi:hypothetical protein